MTPSLIVRRCLACTNFILEKGDLLPIGLITRRFLMAAFGQMEF